MIDPVDPVGNPGDDPKRAGAYDVRVVARTPDGSTERVSVCLYSDRILVQSVDDPEQFRVGRPEAMAVDAGELVFDKTGMAPEPEVSGPQSIPEGGNFFGDWKLRSYAFNSYGQGAEASVHNDRRCQASRGGHPGDTGSRKDGPSWFAATDPSCSRVARRYFLTSGALRTVVYVSRNQPLCTLVFARRRRCLWQRFRA